MAEVTVRETIREWAARKLSESKAILIRKGKVRFAGKISVSISERGGNTTVSVMAPAHAKWVDEGRSAGKMPPVEVIRKWCSGKRIPQSAAFPIARNIGFFGIPPTRFLDPFRKRVYLKDLTGALEKTVAAELEKEVAKIVKNELK